MKRKFKNLILGVVLVLLFGANFGAVVAIQNANSESGGSGAGTEMVAPTISDSSAGETPPSTSGEGETAPADAGNGESPEIPSGTTSTQATDQVVPSNTDAGFDWANLLWVAIGVDCGLIAAILIFWILTGFCKVPAFTIFANPKKVALGAILTCLLGAGLIALDVWFSTMTWFGGDDGIVANTSSTSSASGSLTVDAETLELSGTYASTTADENAILVTNGGVLTLTDSAVTKSGDSTNTENSEFYGINAGILVEASSTATISGAEITTDAVGANAVFATGEDAKITISDSTITTTGDSSSRGLDATYGGEIIGDNLVISTSGGSCATLATDRGEGTVTVTNSELATAGVGSPLIYSTGTISLADSTGTATGSQLVVVEGKNSATVTSSSLTAAGTGNRGDVDDSGVMLYQSMSGDASEGTASFIAVNSTLALSETAAEYTTAPMFFVTNTDAEIDLTNTTLNFGSGILLKIAGTDQWGTSGSNGGDVDFNAENQILVGNIEVDNISTLELDLESSTFSGTINSANSAKSLKLSLDSGSTIDLTGDSYITELDNEGGTINRNGHTLYVNGVAYNG